MPAPPTFGQTLIYEHLEKYYQKTYLNPLTGIPVTSLIIFLIIGIAAD